MSKKNHGSGKIKSGFDNFFNNMCLKHKVSESAMLKMMEQMIDRKRRELGEADDLRK